MSLRVSLVAGLIACGACARDDAPDAEPAPATRAAEAARAPVAAVKAGAAAPVRPARLQSLEDFQKTLERKFDRRQIVEQATPEGVLYIPNDFAAHAIVAVKNPDGTVGQQCLSSPVHARAVADQIRQGAAR